MAYANHNSITIKLDKVYSISLVQGKAVTPYADDYAEVALIRTDDVYNAFVPPNAWCPMWVGEDYYDDVIVGCDAHDVLELLNHAKEYVFVKDKQNVSA
jgi:hypothetical protein